MFRKVGSPAVQPASQPAFQPLTTQTKRRSGSSRCRAATRGEFVISNFEVAVLEALVLRLDLGGLLEALDGLFMLVNAGEGQPHSYVSLSAVGVQVQRSLAVFYC